MCILKYFYKRFILLGDSCIYYVYTIAFFYNQKKSHIFYHCNLWFLNSFTTLCQSTSIYPVSMFFGSVDRETAILIWMGRILNKVQENKRKYTSIKLLFMDYRLGLYTASMQTILKQMLLWGNETHNLTFGELKKTLSQSRF